MLWLTDVLHVGSIEFVVQVKKFWYVSRQALIGQLLLVRLGSTWTATSCHSTFGERLLHVTCPLGFLNVTLALKHGTNSFQNFIKAVLTWSDPFFPRKITQKFYSVYSSNPKIILLWLHKT